MELLLTLMKMMAAVIISFVFFLFSIKLLIKLFFSKVNSDEYEERLAKFLNKRSVLKQRKLNRL
ncbi:hypothetical protein [Fulvivirga sp.]|uniref:hypothetical protein n=1 Tax=Fulvivirga sp. TaxID=1931237 RepID=UPI0032ED6E6A